MPRKTLSELKTHPPVLAPAMRARLDARSPDDIDAAAKADTVNPEWSDERLKRAAFARDVRCARETTGLTQDQFAKRYQIALTRLKDWEQARFKPDSVAMAYLQVITHDAKAVDRALALAASIKAAEQERA